MLSTDAGVTSLPLVIASSSEVRTSRRKSWYALHCTLPCSQPSVSSLSLNDHLSHTLFPLTCLPVSLQQRSSLSSKSLSLHDAQHLLILTPYWLTVTSSSVLLFIFYLFEFLNWRTAVLSQQGWLWQSADRLYTISNRITKVTLKIKNLWTRKCNLSLRGLPRVFLYQRCQRTILKPVSVCWRCKSMKTFWTLNGQSSAL